MQYKSGSIEESIASTLSRSKAAIVRGTGSSELQLIHSGLKPETGESANLLALG